MKWAAYALALSLALAFPGQAIAAGANGQMRARDCTVHIVTPPGREVIDEGVTRIAVQAAFNPSGEQQRLLSLLILLSAHSENGRSR